MDIIDRIARFDKRWAIVSNDNDRLVKFMNAAKISIGKVCKKYDDISFVKKFKRIGQYDFSFRSYDCFASVSRFIFSEANELNLLLRKIQIFLWIIIKYDQNLVASYLNEDLKNAGMNIRLIKIDDDYEFVPKGAEELDESLVNETLDWLTDYPEVSRHFCSSLSNYMVAEQESNATNIRATLDDLRFTLEQFLKEFHEVPMNTGWEKLFNATTKYLKAQSVAPQIRSVYTTILNYYDAYQNSNVKHTFGAKANEIEFILYQTGSLIRFLIQLKREEEAETA